jgi:(heptosyl)LPS beta-1,4-glucosyltransferase
MIRFIQRSKHVRLMKPSSRLTAVVLARDEEDNLQSLLPTLDFADRILVVDGGSRDDTAGIARRHGADVLQTTDWQGYGVQRRRAEERIRDGWILMIDADERIPRALAHEIREAVTHTSQPCVFTVARKTWVFGRYLRHGGWYPDRVARLYTKDAAEYDSRPVHERLVIRPGVPVRDLQTPLLHFSYRDLEHYLVKSARYAALSGNLKKSRGEHGSLLRAIFHGTFCFFRMYIIKLGFLDGRQGFLIAVLSAHSIFCKYADVWVREQPSPPDVVRDKRSQQA